MDIPGPPKSSNSALSFRYNANNEELEELYGVCEDDPPTPLAEASPTVLSESASPKRADKTSIIDKYFKSMRVEKGEKIEEPKSDLSKGSEEHSRNSTPVKEVTSSPVKDYLNRLSKRSNTPSTSEITPEVKDGSNETWKIFRDFKYKLAQTVEDMKSRSVEETKEKSVPRENSTSDSEENSAVKDLDQSVEDTDNQVSSLASSLQNLSDITQPITAKANDFDASLPRERNNSESTDDTHKNLELNDTTDIQKDLFDDNALLDVESGVEALEDTNMDIFTDGDILDCDTHLRPNSEQSNTLPSYVVYTDHSCQPPSENNILKPDDKPKQPKASLFTFCIYFLVFLIVASYAIFPNANTWNGFLYGLLFVAFMANMKQWVLDHYFKESEEPSNFYQVKTSLGVPSTYTIPSVKEYKPIKKYESWINHYRFPDYDPISYHINKTTTAFMKLEGCNLRISYTKTKVAKRALWDEKLEKVLFYQHRLYNLTGARLFLLPKGLVKRRQWSKKYPICVQLGENEHIRVLEKEASTERRPSEQGSTEKKRDLLPTEVESAETNTSPEKKKKFIWRRREKSAHSEGEGNREGLRHRLVRKMHRDKKVDNVSTTTESTEGSLLTKDTLDEPSTFFDAEMELTTKSATSANEEEELDESEMAKIKDLLEEADTEAGSEGASEGEWSVHVRSTHHTRLYLFARTGRDKHEWFRRLDTAISEANAASVESSSEERAASEPSERDLRDLAVYKVAEKDTVSFPKPMLNKSLEALTDQSQYSVRPPPLLHHSDIEGYEKLFWPFLFKIIQQSKSPSPSCECRLLPPEVTWVNTVMARVLYDIMSDPKLVSRVQDRMQRKLNTIKLPSFMSPLQITELSLAGACPLVSRVVAPAWDERGVWLDADLRYDGGAYIAILTQINLMKLKEKNASPEEQLLAAETILENEMSSSTAGLPLTEKQLRERKPAIYDSDVEDSAESSSDDESPPVQPVDSSECIAADSQTSVPTPDSASSKKKFLRMVDKIATNKYFQQVTDYKYVKRAMEGLSNTDIKLQLEVHGLEGRLALNLPPPPHDRLWVGFRTNPQLILKARPAFGARTLRFAHITNWIEEKLTKEFEKFLVLPNMEDFVIELMTPTPVLFE